jgi:TATA-binding protein-associated factor Taf7
MTKNGRPRVDTMQTETKTMDADNHDPRHHTQMMQQRLQQTIDHLRKDIEKVDEPQFKAMFETSAEVLGGLVKAFKHYEQKNESAWRR